MSDSARVPPDMLAVPHCDGRRDHRATWKQGLSHSGLPPEVQQVIRSVVRRSRLTRSEKTAVAGELIAHFQDGMESGRSAAQLIAAFGDLNIAAKLIRSSKIRNRTMFSKIARASALIGTGGLVAWVISLLVFYTGKPAPSLDYVVELNQPVDSMKEQDKAWNVYRDVWARTGFCDGKDSSFEEIFHRNPDDESDRRLIRPGDAGWTAATEKLAASAEILENLREGAKLPHLGLKLFVDRSRYSRDDFSALFPDEDPDNRQAVVWWEMVGLDESANQLISKSLAGMLLPHVSTLRKSARILIVDTRWAMEEGDTDRAVRNIETILGLSRQAAEPELLVCALVGFSISQMAYDLIDEVLAPYPDVFDLRQLERIQRAIEAVEPRNMISMQGEKLMIRDMIQRIYTDDGNGDGRVTADGLQLARAFDVLYQLETGDAGDWTQYVRNSTAIGGPMSLWYTASRKELNERADRLFAEIDRRFERPFHEGVYFNDIVKSLKEDSDRYPVLDKVVPALHSAHSARERALANRDGMLLALAAHRFRLTHGDWPESVEGLMAFGSSRAPVDPFDGKPLRMTVLNGEFRVYSLGPDRDDDQGRSLRSDPDGAFPPPGVDQEQWWRESGHQHLDMPASQFWLNTSSYLDGDWVIWPRRSGQRFPHSSF